jgi:hypothetical protein
MPTYYTTEMELCKWNLGSGMCVLQPGVHGVFLGDIGQFPHIGSGARVEVEGQRPPHAAADRFSPMYHLNDSRIFLLAPSFMLPPSLRRFRGKVGPVDHRVGPVGHPLGPLGLGLGPCPPLVL